jgi:hypothetical protein
MRVPLHLQNEFPTRKISGSYVKDGDFVDFSQFGKFWIEDGDLRYFVLTCKLRQGVNKIEENIGISHKEGFEDIVVM